MPRLEADLPTHTTGPYWPQHLLAQVRETMLWVDPDARIVFRDAVGVEHPVAKVKVRGFTTVVICERGDD